MNNVKKFLFATICFCLLAVPRPAQAEEIEVLRGEEEETEVFLEGTDEVYSLYGELKGTTDFVLLLKPEGENLSRVRKQIFL